MSVLQLIAETPPSTYFDREPNGLTVLENLHSKSVSASILSPSARDDETLWLYGIFDVAVSSGFGRLVLDYTLDVCQEREELSIRESYASLLRIECVVIYLSKAMSRVRSNVTAWIEQSVDCERARSEGATADALGHIIQGILSSHGLHRGKVTKELEQLAQEGKRLGHCCQVLEWLVTDEFLRKSKPSRWTLAGPWEERLKQCRDSAEDGSLLLDLLLRNIRKCDVEVSYPPQSFESLISCLFLSGQTTREALTHKLAVLAYYLIDTRQLTAPDLANEYSAVFRIPRSVCFGWSMQQYLDEGQLGPDDIDGAISQCVSGVDARSLPLQVLASFADLGHPDVALYLLGQRIPSDAIEEARMALQIRLANGLLSEAFIEMKMHLARVPEAKRASHSQSLIGTLLDWAAAMNGIHWIIQLPFSPGLEEEAVLGWLKDCSQVSSKTSLYIPLYYVLRGRIPEALIAYSQHDEGMHDDASEELREQLETLLTSSSQCLAQAQRSLVYKVGAPPSVRLTGDMLPEQEGVLLSGVLSESTWIPGSALSVGPSPVEAPLIGGLDAQLTKLSRSKQKEKAQTAEILQPSLFGPQTRGNLRGLGLFENRPPPGLGRRRGLRRGNVD